jgi:hypothetical protein
MAKFHGRLQTLSFSGDSVGGIEEGSYTWDCAEIDTTDHDDGSRTFIQGRDQGTISLTLKNDSGDVGQAALVSNINNKTGPEAFDMRMGGGRKLTGNAFVTSDNPSGPNDAASMISFTLRMTGTITEASV